MEIIELNYKGLGFKKKEYFLRDLQSITFYNVTYDANGHYGTLEFNGDVQEFMKRHPKATKDHLRRGCMVVMKECGKIAREKWYAGKWKNE